MNAHAWIVSVCGNDSNREIARKARLSDATLSRQISKDALTFDVVIAIARGYDTSVISALVANGYVTPEEASIDSIESALQTATDAQLVEEVQRRIIRGSDAYNGPITGSRPRHLRAVENVDGQEETARRVAKKKSRDRGEDDGGGA